MIVVIQMNLKVFKIAYFIETVPEIFRTQNCSFLWRADNFGDFDADCRELTTHSFARVATYIGQLRLIDALSLVVVTRNF